MPAITDCLGFPNFDSVASQLLTVINVPVVRCSLLGFLRSKFLAYMAVSHGGTMPYSVVARHSVRALKHRFSTLVARSHSLQAS